MKNHFEVFAHGEAFDPDAYLSTAPLKFDGVWRKGESNVPNHPKSSGVFKTLGDGLTLPLFEQAIDKIDPGLSPDARAAALKGIDDAVYGLMMVLDGVSGRLQNAKLAVHLKVAAQLVRREPANQGDLIADVDLFEGDGMCMGYHGWLEGDFGEDPIILAGARGKAG
jgi:hypothetical protein